MYLRHFLGFSRPYPVWVGEEESDGQKWSATNIFLQPNYFAGQGQTDIAVAIHELWSKVHTVVLRNTTQQECNILVRVVSSCHNMLVLQFNGFTIYDGPDVEDGRKPEVAW